jgi:hypothetical protein
MLTGFLYPCQRETYTEGTMRALTGCLVLVFAACGGGSVTTEPKSGADASNAADSSEAERGQEDGETSSEASASRQEPQGPKCDDGTCSQCGSSICLTGWYCDEKASACSWLAECADKPSCSCVSRVLGSGCKCREEAGALKVACD